MSDTGRLIASGANELNFADVKGHFLRNDAALRNLHGGFGVAFDFVNAFDDDFAGVGAGGNDFALFTLILTGEDLNGIALFNVEFNERQDGTSFTRPQERGR